MKIKIKNTKKFQKKTNRSLLYIETEFISINFNFLK